MRDYDHDYDNDNDNENESDNDPSAFTEHRCTGCIDSANCLP
jgi:hypothetical protein